MGAKTYVVGAIRLAAAAVVAVLLAAGTSCSSPDASFSGLNDEQLKDLFPSESEVALTVGQQVTLSEPEPIDFRRSATAAPNPGLFPDCYAAYFGTPESNSSPALRGYTMAGWIEGSPLYPYTWHLVERPSAEEARRVVRETVIRLGKCRHFTAFDPEVDEGLGVTFRKITGAEDSRTGAGVAVAVGDVTVSFSVSGLPQPEAREIAQEMATVMEKRLKAVSPK